MSISIKDIVALTGTPGLHRIIKADDRSVIVESLDERQKRQMIKGNMMVSKLIDVSIYTQEESESLLTIFDNIREKYGQDLPVNKKSSKNELMAFLVEVLPDYDQEKVYPSNVKKIVNWYEILSDLDVDWTVEEEGEEVTSEETSSDEGIEQKADLESDKGESTEDKPAAEKETKVKKAVANEEVAEVEKKAVAKKKPKAQKSEETSVEKKPAAKKKAAPKKTKTEPVSESTEEPVAEKKPARSKKAKAK